jgi:hypothetical protein
MKAMNGKGPGDKVVKKVAKATDKAVKRMDSGKDASKSIKRMAKAGATPSDLVSVKIGSVKNPLTGPFKQAVMQKTPKRK